MIVLGLSTFNPFGWHDSAATIVENGRILASVQEERMTNVKHDSNLPFNSIKECMRIAKLEARDIDAVACCWSKVPVPRFAVNRKSLPEIFNARNYAAVPFKSVYRSFMLNRIKTWFGIRKDVYFVDHHLSHAASAFYTSGFKDACIVTLDGVGDLKAGTIYNGYNGHLKEMSWMSSLHSLGHFFGCASEALGFKWLDGEGKTMGLACYGKPIYKEQIEKIFDNGKLIFTDDMKINFQDKKLFSPYKYLHNTMTDDFRKILGNKVKVDVAKENAESKKWQTHADFAASAQDILEERGMNYVRKAIEKTGKGKIAMAGGVMLNVKLNKRIKEMDGVEKVFIHPAAGDNGACTGAAIEVCKMLEPNSFRPEKMQHCYYGSSYSDEEILDALKEFGLKYEELKDPAGTAADLINAGKVVGWFQGRMEYGPRALGSRSVLADPTDPKMRDRINAVLKRRDWFMPFCPSMLDEAKEEYLVDPDESPFMIMAFDVPKEKVKEIPAVTHIDGTVRPQTVKKNVNPLYWRVIKQFEKHKVPLVLNTSFNKHGLPIVRTPSDAISHLVWNCIDVLIVGNFLVERQFA